MFFPDKKKAQGSEESLSRGALKIFAIDASS
jgi:hypothetical protein